ncbi:MAG TPA: hypothetical protein VEZ24_15585 [Microvirga sp.]|nr:hypothetical protein [Microvirga sp.]
MYEDDRNVEELRRRLVLAQAELARRERLTAFILGGLTFFAVMAIGLLIGHIADAPLLPSGE